jgi:IS5 family transposase
VDKGYRGHRQNQSHFDPETRQDIRAPWRVFMAGRKARKPHLKAELKRRSAIEPVIGHLKSDHRMGRNYLKGKAGDRFNVKMAAIGFNFRRVLAWLLAWLKDFLREIVTAIVTLLANRQPIVRSARRLKQSNDTERRRIFDTLQRIEEKRDGKQDR